MGKMGASCYYYLPSPSDWARAWSEMMMRRGDYYENRSDLFSPEDPMNNSMGWLSPRQKSRRRWTDKVLMSVSREIQKNMENLEHLRCHSARNNIVVQSGFKWNPSRLRIFHWIVLIQSSLWRNVKTRIHNRILLHQKLNRSCVTGGT